ncbi:MAG TPA: DUF992 domain-containing protein [Caulobacteraceae bacterium]|nr:DUF992 domain-containing protein [Caulobacteraceae bacterium]
MKTFLLCASLLGALGWTTGAMAHEGGVKIGTLSCHEKSGWGFILGSSRPVRCFYSGINGRARYDGRISRFGVDIGYQGPSNFVWAVFAPTERLGPGALDGHYGGVTAGAAVGVGLGANALIGGSERTIALQPLSVEGRTGFDVAAGIGALNLHEVR